MNYTLVEENTTLWGRIFRPVIKAARSVYIQRSNVIGLLPSEKAIRLYYKYRCKSYDLQWFMDPGYDKGLARLIELTVQENDRVLDVGCGTGSATRIAAEKAREVVGIDLSPDMIEFGTRKMVKSSVTNVTLISCSVEGYQPEEKFDKVISSFMIPHVKPALRPSIYSCMFNFLKPGGLVGLFGSRGEVCSMYETQQEAEANLLKAGFEDIEIVDVHDIYRIALARKAQ